MFTIYNKTETKNIFSSYAQRLYSNCPSRLRDSIAQAVENICNAPTVCNAPPTGVPIDLDQIPQLSWTNNPGLPRAPWNVQNLLDAIPDPWFVWDFENGCSINDLIISDIFDNNPPPSPIYINPSVNTVGYDTDKLDLIKTIGGVYHFLCARTYYIDRCYGTTQYLNFYYNGSSENFISQHKIDFLDYVDNTGMIKGNKLLEAWRDNNFRASINILQFIKPVAGLFCEDFWHWDNPNIYWWSQSGSWDTDLIMSDVWYGNTGSTININESKLITTLNNNPFPGYRISLNDLYFGITYPESDNLAFLFGNNLLKGPSDIVDIPEPYNDTCVIVPPFEEPPVLPPTTYINPQSIDIIKDISINNNNVESISDNVDVFRIINSNTSTLLLLTSCSVPGEAMNDVFQAEPDIIPNLPVLPCSDEIDVVTNIFIENNNLRVTKHRVKIISVLDPVNVSSEITTTASCDESTLNATNSNNLNITGCDGSVYNDPEWTFPKNITNISFVTDVYIDGAGSLVQKKSNITVINKNNNADIVKTFAVIWNCDGNPPVLPPPPPPPPQQNNVLFDKTSWSTVEEPWKTYLDNAADRWNGFLKLDPEVITTMRKLYSGWNGIRLDNITFTNQPNSYILAGCGINRYINLPNNKANALGFNLSINIGRINFSRWADTITHELGHALGIGGSWGGQNQSTLSGTLYPNTLAAYNDIIGNTIQNNTIIPIESTGMQGTKDVHFENDARTINGVLYPGLTNEVMIGTNSSPYILSKLSIQNAVDIGYVEINAGASEGNPTLDNTV